jgi:hypothetical protein
MKILAIDPGNIESAYVVLDDVLKPLEFAKESNITLIEKIYSGHFEGVTHIAIEMIASYGMSVGKTVFETCVWIGKFEEALGNSNLSEAKHIYRRDEKMNLCHSVKAKDSNVIQALKDRFGDKGTKKNPGWFFGFAKDMWQAYAVGVTYADVLSGDYVLKEGE